jgi:ABC-2 type transport system permease protein
MNNRMWCVVQQEIKDSLRRRSYLLLTFGAPILAIVMIGAIVWFQGERAKEGEEPVVNIPRQPIGYVDQSGLFAEPGSYADIFIPYASAEAARSDVAAGRIGGFYLIPGDYLATGQVTRYATQINVAQEDRALFESFLLDALLADEDPQLVNRLHTPAVVVEHQVDGAGVEETTRQGNGPDLFWLVYLFSMLMMLTTFLTSGQLMQGVLKEKENRTVEIVLSSVRPLQLMAGKLIGQGLMGWLQMGTWLGAILVLIRMADVEVPLLRFLNAATIPLSLLVAATIYYLLGFALFGAFAAGIGAISVNLREGPQYAILYSLPAALPMMFLPIIADAPNSALAMALSFFPLSAPMGMIERMVVTTVPAWQVGLSLAILLFSVIGSLWLAARLFRVNTLLAGQLPTRRELWQLLYQG